MSQLPTNQPTAADRWAVVFALVYPTALTYVYFTLLAATPPIVQNLTSAVLKCVQFGFPLFWYLRIQRRTVRLQRPPPTGMAWGLAFGLTVAAAMWLLYRDVLTPWGLMDQAAVAIRAKIVGFGVDTLPAYATLGIFYSLIHSLLEEYYWRWFVFAQLCRLAKTATAVAVSSLGFAAHHVLLLGTFFGFDSPLTWLLSAAVAMGGAVWAWLFHTSRSLAAVWLSHLLIDAGIFLLGYDMFRGDLW